MSLAEERLARCLDARCVPDGLVRAMVRMRLDPFAPVERRLQELDCERRRLRPDSAIASWSGESSAPDTFAQAARAQAERMSPGKCRKAYDALFGLDKPLVEMPED